MILFEEVRADAASIVDYYERVLNTFLLADFVSNDDGPQYLAGFNVRSGGRLTLAKQAWVPRSGDQRAPALHRAIEVVSQ